MQNRTKYTNYPRGIVSSDKNGGGLLRQIDENLQLAGDELLRMEDEGGAPLTKKQNAKISAYETAQQRIRELLISNGCRPSRSTPDKEK